MRRPFLVKLLSLLVVLAGAFALFLMRGPVSSAEEKLTMTWQALREAPQWTLYSIDPVRHEPRPPIAKLIQGYEVLGKLVVSSPDIRQRIIKDLQRAVSASDGAAMCFNPRHGIQIHQGEKVLDVLICFECEVVHTYTDNVMSESAPLRGSADFLNEMLRAAGVPIAP